MAGGAIVNLQVDGLIQVDGPGVVELGLHGGDVRAAAGIDIEHTAVDERGGGQLVGQIQRAGVLQGVRRNDDVGAERAAVIDCQPRRGENAVGGHGGAGRHHRTGAVGGKVAPHGDVLIAKINRADEFHRIRRRRVGRIVAVAQNNRPRIQAAQLVRGQRQNAGLGRRAAKPYPQLIVEGQQDDGAIAVGNRRIQHQIVGLELDTR